MDKFYCKTYLQTTTHQEKYFALLTWVGRGGVSLQHAAVHVDHDNQTAQDDWSNNCPLKPHEQNTPSDGQACDVGVTPDKGKQLQKDEQYLYTNYVIN